MDVGLVFPLAVTRGPTGPFLSRHWRPVSDLGRRDQVTGSPESLSPHDYALRGPCTLQASPKRPERTPERIRVSLDVYGPSTITIHADGLTFISDRAPWVDLSPSGTPSMKHRRLLYPAPYSVSREWATQAPYGSKGETLPQEPTDSEVIMPCGDVRMSSAL